MTQNNATNAAINQNGTLAFSIVPGYAGPLKFYVYTSQYADFTVVSRPYDVQLVSFAVSDTAISAAATNFTAQPMLSFTNQLLATFTNGVPNSSTGNFSALINWGDNSTNAATITTNLAGRKEVRGSHTYANSGSYPVYVAIQSSFGSSTTVVANVTVPPNLSLVKNGNNSVLRWPAWASEFRLQSSTNLATSNWDDITNLPSLVGYENVVTNVNAATNQFFRLRR